MKAGIAFLVWGLAFVPPVMPAGAATPTTLHEIGRGAAMETLCVNVVVHANAAIAAVNRADVAIARAVARLRSPDFDEAALGRRNALNDVAHAAGDTLEHAARGSAEVQRLFDIADRSPTPHRDELREFATPLGAALERQRKIAGDLTNFLTAVQNDDIRQAPHDTDALQTQPQSNAIARVPGWPATANALARSGLEADRHKTFAASPRSLANELDGRMGAIGAEESRAAEHAEAAVRGCS